MKVALSGPAGSGKNYVADILVRDWGFTQTSFAEPMKQAASIITGYTREQVDQVKEGNLHPWNQAKMRKLLQHLGTEIGRNIWGETTWIDNFLRRAEGIQRIVLTDCRFRNEFDALKQAGFLMVYVDCPPEYRRLKGEAANHPSETDILPYVAENRFDAILWNDRQNRGEHLAYHIVAADSWKKTLAAKVTQ